MCVTCVLTVVSLMLSCGELVPAGAGSAITAALWAVLLIRGYRPPLSWSAAVLLGLLEPALAYLGETFGLSMTIVLNLIPAFGLLSSMIFLGEEPTRSGIIGACLIGGSVIYFTICHSRATEPDLSSAAGPETLIHDVHAPETEKPHAAAGQSAR
jgi:drug/metabolite transporter (DMT)-like permease